MKILVIIHNQSDTGPFFKVRELCEAIAELENEVTLLCTSKNSRLIFKNYSFNKIQIWESPDLLWGRFRQGIDPWNLMNRLFYLYNKKFNILHAIDCRPVVIIPALFLSKLSTVPLILSWWDWFGRGGTALERSGLWYSKTFGLIETFFEEYFRKYGDAATVITTTLAKRLLTLGYPKDKIHLIRVGVKVNKIKIVNQQMVREKLSLPIKRKIFCYVGSLFKSDALLLIESLRILKKETMMLPLTLLIGNNSVDSKICEELSIKIIGKVEDENIFFKYLLASDFGLLPLNLSVANMSRWPSKISDYLACGLPLASTPVSDLPSIFIQYKIGLISNDDSVKEYAKMLSEAINLNVEECERLRRNSRAYAETHLDWNILNHRLLKLYESIV